MHSLSIWKKKETLKAATFHKFRFIREGVQKKNVPFSSLLLLRGGGVVGDVKELLGFFINHVFIGVFQYDSGPPKHALELRGYVKYMCSHCIFTLNLMILMILMASPQHQNLNLKYKLPTGLLRGRGGSPDPLLVKDYY